MESSTTVVVTSLPMEWAEGAVRLPAMRRSLVLILLLLVLAASACTSTAGAPVATTTTSTTIGVTVRATGERAVTFGADVDAGLADQLETQLVDLASSTEVLRGLSFLSPASFVLLGESEARTRWEAYLDGRLDPVALAADTRLFRLLGLLTPAQDLRALLRSAVGGASVPAFYDETTGEVVVVAEQAELDPFTASVVVRSLTEALTDQYHRFTARTADLRADGRYDEATALATLAAADAITTQLRYLETLPDTARVAAAAQDDVFAPPSAPPFVQGELAYPTDDGIAFLAALLDSGGLGAVDQAYSAALTTELVSHPVRYFAGEGVLAIDPPVVDAAGLSVQDAGSLGELGLRSLLVDAVSPGVLTQTVDGWGADRFLTLTDASDVAFVYLFRGDSVADTVEVAQAFLNHAAFVMALAEPIAAGGGVEFVGPAPAEGEEPPATEDGAPPAGPYVYVDRAGAGLLVVISSDVAAGRSLVREIEVP